MFERFSRFLFIRPNSVFVGENGRNVHRTDVLSTTRLTGVAAFGLRPKRTFPTDLSSTRVHGVRNDTVTIRPRVAPFIYTRSFTVPITFRKNGNRCRANRIFECLIVGRETMIVENGRTDSAQWPNHRATTEIRFPGSTPCVILSRTKLS